MNKLFKVHTPFGFVGVEGNDFQLLLSCQGSMLIRLWQPVSLLRRSRFEAKVMFCMHCGLNSSVLVSAQAHL
jgi:hypothetical protein